MKQRGPAWISGPDPLHHEMYVAYGYQYQSARRRKEPWFLTWEEWRDIWLPHWDQRGRSATSLCLSRSDVVGSWAVENVELITRKEHGRKIRRYYS